MSLNSLLTAIACKSGVLQDLNSWILNSMSSGQSKYWQSGSQKTLWTFEWEIAGYYFKSLMSQCACFLIEPGNPFSCAFI